MHSLSHYLISRTECPEAVQTMVKYMGIRDLGYDLQFTGQQAPSFSCFNILSYKMDLMIGVPDL